MIEKTVAAVRRRGRRRIIGGVLLESVGERALVVACGVLRIDQPASAAAYRKRFAAVIIREGRTGGEREIAAALPCNR